MTFTRRHFLVGATAFALLPKNFWAAEPNSSKDLINRTGWPPLGQGDEAVQGIRLSDDEAKAVMTYKINTLFFYNSAVRANLKNRFNLEIKDGKATWAAHHIVLPAFCENALKKAHAADASMNPMIKVKSMWDGFIQHCSDHILEVGTRWISVNQQKISLHPVFSWSSGLHPYEGELLGNIDVCKKIFGPVETWPEFKTLSFDPQKVDIWNDAEIKRLVRQMNPVNMMGVVDKMGVSRDFLKVSPNDLHNALNKNPDQMPGYNPLLPNGSMRAAAPSQPKP